MNAAKFADKVGRRLHGMINKERKKRDISPLRGRKPLIQAAESHSKVMADKGEIFHNGPDGSPQSRRPTGYRGIAENVAYVHERGSTGKAAGKLLDNWMNSPPHRENLLDDRNKYDGLGIWVEGSRVYATHMMARRGRVVLKPGQKLRSLARKTTPPYSIRQRQIVYGSGYGTLAFLAAAAITSSGDVPLADPVAMADRHLSVRSGEFARLNATNAGQLAEYLLAAPTLAVALGSVLCAVHISGTSRLRYLLENTAPAALSYFLLSCLATASLAEFSQDVALGFGITAAVGWALAALAIWRAR